MAAGFPENVQPVEGLELDREYVDICPTPLYEESLGVDF